MAELTDAQWAAEVSDVVADLIAGTITEEQAAARLTAATTNWPTRSLSNAALAQRVNELLDQLATNPPGGGTGPLPEGLLTEETADGRYAMRSTALTPEFLELREKVKFFAYCIPEDISQSISPNIRPLSKGLLDIWATPTLADRFSGLRDLLDSLAQPEDSEPWSGTPEEMAQQLIALVKLLSPGIQGNGDIVQALGQLMAPRAPA